MNFNPFSLLKKNTTDLLVPDSILVKRIKSLAKNSTLKVFSNVDIYFHRECHNIELMLYDNKRGLYLFEIKKWSFNDLKDATIEKAQNQEHANNTLAFDKTQELIQRKFNEIIHSDGPKIHNYLLMENLSAQEYEHLDDSFKELLPEEKIIFNNCLASDIFKKIESEEEIYKEGYDQVLETLFTQYAKVGDDGNFILCNDEEIAFLESNLKDITTHTSCFRDGKTSLLLLKAIIELFKGNARKIILIKPSILARDIAYKKLLEIVEHGIIEFDMGAIELLTPLELINRHLQKLKKPMIQELEQLDPKLLKKSFNIADLIICDDAALLPESFIDYIKHIQKNKKALFVNLEECELSLNKQTTSKVEFLETNPLAKTMHLLQELLKENKAEDVLVVSNPQNKEKLREDLEHFIREEIVEVKSSKTLLEQNLDGLRLVTYDDMFELSTKYVILLDLCDYNEKQIEYALNLATKNSYALYDNSCETIELLKEKYESNENRARVEETTNS